MKYVIIDFVRIPLILLGFAMLILGAWKGFSATVIVLAIICFVGYAVSRAYIKSGLPEHRR